jgi:hypothetical protein
MDLRETGWGGMDWTDLALDRGQWRALVNTAMKFWVLWNVGNFLSSWVTGELIKKGSAPWSYLETRLRLFQTSWRFPLFFRSLIFRFSKIHESGITHWLIQRYVGPMTDRKRPISTTWCYTVLLPCNHFRRRRVKTRMELKAIDFWTSQH